VLAGIDAAATAGLAPVKVNMVVKRGTNEASIVPMARHFKGSGHIVATSSTWMSARRTAGGWTTSYPRSRSSARSMPFCRSSPSDANYAGEVAERWRYRDGSGEIGVIASVTQAFCRDCTRARLSTTASSTRAFSRPTASTCAGSCVAGASDAMLGNAVAAIWRQRADRYSEIRTGQYRRRSKRSR
jgi:cyclic pyranopterin phosphate synthase